MCVQLDFTLDKNCPFCIMLILWSQMNKISLIHLMHKALHKMQSDCKRTEKGNPVAWRLRHFSWQSRVTSAAVIISVFYIHWKKKKTAVRRDRCRNPAKIDWSSPQAQGFASHPCSIVWQKDLNIHPWHSSKHINHWAVWLFSFFLFRETDYIPVFWCIGKQPVGIWTKQTSFPSFFPDRKGVSMSPSSNKLGTWDIWQRLFLWSQY